MKQYLVPFNINIFDGIKAYSKLTDIDWTLKSKSIKVGDEVYFYCSKPVQMIVMKGIVSKINVNFDEHIDDREFYIDTNAVKTNTGKTYTRIKFICKYSDEKSSMMSLEKLRQNGLRGNIQTAQMINKNKDLHDYINSVDYTYKD